MENKYPVWGWVMAGLGGLGVVVTLALLIGLWVAGLRVKQAGDHVVEKAEAGLNQLGKAVLDSEQRITRTRDRVTEVDERIKQRIRENLGLDQDLLISIRDMEQQVQSGLVEVRGWIEVAQSGLNVAGELVLTVEALGYSLDEVSRSLGELQAASRQGLTYVEQGSQAADELGTRLEDLGEAHDAAQAARIDSLARRIDASLVDLLDATQRVEEAIEQVKDRIYKMQRTANRILLMVQLGCSFLLAWQMAAQGCLAWTGYRMAKGTS